MIPGSGHNQFQGGRRKAQRVVSVEVLKWLYLFVLKTLTCVMARRST